MIAEGMKFNLLTAVKLSHKVGKKPYWVFNCDCGNTKTIRTDMVIMGSTKACGCLNGEKINGLRFTKEYRAWTHAKDRCNNPNNQSYHNYGGRGITFCEEWKNSFLTFLKDIGYAPTKKHTLERIENDKGYSPTNCKWATYKEQLANRRKHVGFNRKLYLSGYKIK